MSEGFARLHLKRPLGDVAFARQNSAGIPPIVPLAALLGTATQILEQAPSLLLVLPDVLVDRLVADGKAAFQPQATGYLFWAPLLLQQSPHLLPLFRSVAEASPFPLSPRRRIALSDRSAVGSVAVTGISSALPEDSARRPTDGSGHLRDRLAAFTKGRDGVSFIQRELLVPTHVFVPFLAEFDVHTGWQLSQSCSRVLHLVLEFAPDNKSLELTPWVHF